MAINEAEAQRQKEYLEASKVQDLTLTLTLILTLYLTLTPLPETWP